MVSFAVECCPPQWEEGEAKGQCLAVEALRCLCQCAGSQEWLTQECRWSEMAFRIAKGREE